MIFPNQASVLLAGPDPQASAQIEHTLRLAGYQVSLHNSVEPLYGKAPDVVILCETTTKTGSLNLATEWCAAHPLLPIILITSANTSVSVQDTLRAGIADWLQLPIKVEDLHASVSRQLALARRRRTYAVDETVQDSSGLQQHVAELETLAALGRSIVSSLDLDTVLTSVVEAAVNLTGAEEGSLLLLDEKTGELYVRAARNFNDDFVRAFRLPIQDTLAGSVLFSGRPVLIDQSAPTKIKTSYLVHSLLYVPLQLNDRVFGVLGVDNRLKRVVFTEGHIRLLETLAGYAVIAIENARLYADTCAGRAKLEAILTSSEDGVILMNPQQRLMMINPSALRSFGLTADGCLDRPFKDVFTQSDLLELVETGPENPSNRIEVNLEDGRVLLALLTIIPEIGQAIILHDITYLKKLDRTKSDFVSAVSHDLRSPLTAVLGYVELIERAGPVTELQREFIRRVQGSVHNISALIDDLVNLGRIEAGFDNRKEALAVKHILTLSAEGLHARLVEKELKLSIALPEDLPPAHANAVQLRQAIDHLLDNAIRYTPRGGMVAVCGGVKDGQMILQFRDSGIGIPAADLPFIFDKFYRAANASAESTGTGLGLSIVKSIIDNHRGRVWVDSAPGKGSTFSLLLPLHAP